MKALVTKYEDIEVEVSEEQIELLMLTLLKEDYEAMLEIGEVAQDLVDAIKVVYEAYAGKPIDLVERFTH